MRIDSNDYLAIIFEKEDYSLILFPKADDFLKHGMDKFNSILRNSNFYASAQFGFKLIDFICLNHFDEPTADALEIFVMSCIPFGKIIDDDFEAYATLLYEQDDLSPSPETPSKSLPSQSKLVAKGPVKKINVIIQVK
jgi:hypothetical protein